MSFFKHLLRLLIGGTVFFIFGIIFWAFITYIELVWVLFIIFMAFGLAYSIGSLAIDIPKKKPKRRRRR